MKYIYIPIYLALTSTCYAASYFEFNTDASNNKAVYINEISEGTKTNTNVSVEANSSASATAKLEEENTGKVDVESFYAALKSKCLTNNSPVFVNEYTAETSSGLWECTGKFRNYKTRQWDDYIKACSYDISSTQISESCSRTDGGGGKDG